MIPRARRNEISGERAGRLIVRTTVAPNDGAANKAVRRMIADHFGIPLRSVEIVSGHTHRDKTVRIQQ